jgi:hypothetical protein
MAFKKGNTPYNFDDLTGKIFNRLTVVERVYKENTKKTYWKCKCSCGKETIVESSKIKFTTTMESELLKKIKIQAIKEHLPVSAILERLIKEYLSSLPNND